MKFSISNTRPHCIKCFTTFTIVILSLLFQFQAHALTISVVDPNGNPVSGFRYLLEEDTSHYVVPGVSVPNPLTVGIHRSYNPTVLLNNGVAAAEHVAGSTATIDNDNGRRYILSILPDLGFTNGGANIDINQDIVSITVSPAPLPVAQISILVFEDTSPINSIADLPREKGLPGFTVFISDAAGKMFYDIFGNLLGTVYQKDATGNVALDPNGEPIIMLPGTGSFLSDAKGEVLIKNLAPGKYGVRAIPPSGTDWSQTNTIEGSPTIDAWVRAGEPAKFGNFGPPNKHVWFGFVQPFSALPPAATTSIVNGRIVNAHNSAPPNFTFNPGHPLPNCWVGLNKVESREAVLVQTCNTDSTFSLNNVPPGEYQLAIWDKYLENIFTLQGITVPADGTTLALGDIPVFRWFGYFKSYVFYDKNQNGFRECFAADGITPSGDPADCNDPFVDEIGLPDQAINLRFRDGSIYQTLPTNLSGEAPFDNVFPFLKFLISEVDFTRLKATGATVVVDGGGAVLPDQGWDYPSRGMLTPQPQCESIDAATGNCINPIINPNTGNNLSRTITGPVLTLANQTYLGLTNIVEWGKTFYGPLEHGGITGIVYYATTRAENDPRYAAGEPWEPGIPRVQINLYVDNNRDGIIDDLNGDGSVTLADVDNNPLGNFPGKEDIDRNKNGIFNGGDAVQVTTTDSWDDNLPTGCQAPPYTLNGSLTQDCFEGLRTFNQVRDGVFDGGYAFDTYFPGGMDSGSTETPMPQGDYIVEANTPVGYNHAKEEDRNVDFGDRFIPLRLPPSCVGAPHLVPAELSLFPGEPAPYAGQNRPLCDRKSIFLANGLNGAVDFFMFTDVPKAARVVGFLLNDFANVFDPNHPSYGEKAAPPWMPISIQDYMGNEIARIYSDEFGTYNAVIPSTYTINVPSPTGVSPSMLRMCLNHPGPIVSPIDETVMITDPNFDPQYTQVCYTGDFWPGKTTYLDTPVLPVAATAGRTDYPLDCEKIDGTPEIFSVTSLSGGPYVATTGQSITLTSGAWNGLVSVPNPAYEAGTGTSPIALRDYGFGRTPGTITLGGVPLTNVEWDYINIVATIPVGAQTGELVVTRGDNGKTTQTSITMTVGGPTPVQVPIGGSIQAAIDGALEGSLILVPPGTYNELVVMWKNVTLQGWGSGSTLIDATRTTPDMLAAWKTKVANHIAAAEVDLIPGQTAISNLDEGAGITVIARNGSFGPTTKARIDGFAITNATNGGAIFINGYASNLQISNNRITNSQGTYGGGIRVGHPFLQNGNGAFFYADAFNDDIIIHNNHIATNGSRSQVGGGISMYTGSDRYQVTDNFICGNFSAADGGGIGHLGLSDQAVIANNEIVFNQVFQQTAGAGGAGGGIYITGGGPLSQGNALTPGAGSISISNNLVQGNQAGADDGGGIMLRYVNGQDTAGAQATWYAINVSNNKIVNNLSGLAGAVSLQDTLKATFNNNVIANNESTATSAAAFSNGPAVSTPQAAGVVSRVHTPALATAIAGSGLPSYSDPILSNNIIWHNRSFFWDVSLNASQGGLIPDIAAGGVPVYRDLAVIGTAGSLNPMFSVLTDVTGYDASNTSTPPIFTAEYQNGGPGHLLAPTPDLNILTIPAFDEGGNFLDLSIGPLTLTDPVTGARLGDYQ